ncbi:MAG: FlgD immunoglobulin-like domain containing protein, partial [Rhodothermales bacterium]
GLSVKIVDERIIMPTDYKLSENYPNPFNPTTSFSFTLPLDKSVSVRVYDITGREVKTLVNNQFRAAGTHEVTWDGTNNAGASVSSGTYVYSLEWGQFRQSRTMVLVK